MQFKHPEILWALFLLIIPVLIHLFQLRKFQKEAFTNVAFLKKISLQTRKSSQLKKWLVLCTRMLAFAAIILAFAQPYLSNRNIKTTSEEKVIYLDNSFSMQLQGSQGELLPRAVNQLIENISPSETFSLFTNTSEYKNVGINDIKNELLALPYSSSQLSLNEITLKGSNYFINENSVKNLLVVSDFQERKPIKDSLKTFALNLVQMQPKVKNNTAIDSIFLVDRDLENYTCQVYLSTNFNIESTPVSLFDGDRLIAKTAANFNKGTAYVDFTIPITNQTIKGKIIIEDNGLQYDNELYFSLNKPSKINVLAINEADDRFLKRIFTDDEFNYQSVTSSSIDFNQLSQQNLIVLNELSTISNALIKAIVSSVQNGGKISVIPSEEIDITSYNNLLSSVANMKLNDLVTEELQITQIAYDHPLFKEVFEEKVSNFQFPKTTSFYKVSGSFGSPILYANNAPFLAEGNGLYLFTSPLNENITNFKNAPLIVPTFYNSGKESLALPNLYYTIGNSNAFDVDASLANDEILTISNTENSFIPLQQSFNNKVRITVTDQPSQAGTYSILHEKDSLVTVSFNYNRQESKLNYLDISSMKEANKSFSLEETFKNIKSKNNVDELWKWFVIFALVLLCIELLILKYFK
ncbi:BatA domain-containing protein [Galbibacter sp. BG1]|uniref:BatA domain-containing protein n=1 Tax=Galbibacter sp. BG1 TaxID=1170699 RepID=UPI0015B9ACFA|nr:BatA domain-containing protein [Galbibacter sp. BG1]QLE02493.1 BatA domain-containing protein [Galbibacter sp. BG1]